MDRREKSNENASWEPDERDETLVQLIEHNRELYKNLEQVFKLTKQTMTRLKGQKK